MSSNYSLDVAASKPPTLAQRILIALAAEAIPLSTPTLIELLGGGLSYPRQRIHNVLRMLRDGGLVIGERQRRPEVMTHNRIVTWWRLA